MIDGKRRELALSSAPHFACVEGEEVFHASVDQEAWARSVATDGISRVRQEVSRSLQRGDVSAARQALRGFVAHAEMANESYENERVERLISEVGAMEKDLDDAIAGGAASRSAHGKQLAEEGLDGRRSGAKHH